MNDGDFCVTNNVVTKDDDVANNNNRPMCDDVVKTMDTDKHQTDDENTHFLSVIKTVR